MKTGPIILYIGASISALITIMCIIGWPKLPKTLQLISWGVALLLLIIGAFIDKFSKENYCCDGTYAQIFKTPMNKVREPNDEDEVVTHNIVNNNPPSEYTRHNYRSFGRRRNYISQQYQDSY
jgi:hypothetical protein